MSLTLPADFVALMRRDLGEAQAEALFAGLAEEPKVSVRLNPRKTAVSLVETPVSWCAGDITSTSGLPSPSTPCFMPGPTTCRPL